MDADSTSAEDVKVNVTENGIAEGSTSQDTESKDMTSKDYYFDSYSHFAIHEEMLKDEVRTTSYQHAIEGNAHLFRDKVVLDVGCGTAILCMFAARAGARHVYGVECSAIITQAQQIVADNGLSDRITLIKGKVEEITLPVDQVDIIVSEWMGYFLLYESMLDTVLYARDKWLVPGGLLLPDKASLYLTAIEDADYRKEKIEFWDNVYGFKMGAIKELALTEPLVDNVEQNQVISEATKVLTLDMKTCTKEDLAFKSLFRMRFMRNDYCHALVAFFDVSFSQIHKPLKFSTGPHARYTHWKQTVFYLREAFAVSSGEEISGEISCAPNSGNPRDLDITVKVDFNGAVGEYHAENQYRLR
eukprot:CAMPEP_0113936826 /NCGR_PEP_ID=MMETSP1339-20121228/3608_1 /TAXON_ID=94617 /ORGANISM="Fibrocapsa japonica" /LENGTH=358 /DNA_ID=CAMNT_0000939387 /DNA_START=90 /DNA_END=1166 /DNA_ORIENTATION=- /assembly_acc=CAM_ASM_000762